MEKCALLMLQVPDLPELVTRGNLAFVTYFLREGWTLDPQVHRSRSTRKFECSGLWASGAVSAFSSYAWFDWIHVHASVCGSGGFPHVLHVKVDLRSRGRSVLFARNAWLDSEYMFYVRLGAFWVKFPVIFFVKVVIGP